MKRIILGYTIPAGIITVSDVNLATTPGVRNVNVIVKRWFKIQRLYTDNNGHFTATKHFKHKVKVIVKFKNSYADIKGVRGFRLWQMFLSVSKTIGVYSGNKSNISYNFQQYLNGGNYTNNKGNRFWVAATATNAIQEHRDYASQFSFSPAPTGLRILITNWGLFSGTGSTPLFGKRTDFRSVSNAFISTFIYGGNTNVPGGWTQAWAILSGIHLDMFIDYHINFPTQQVFSSDWIKGNFYHELSHASQYVQSGSTWYNNFVNAELDEQSKNPSGSYNPYGTGVSSNSPIIALGESWAFHMGFYLANQKYNLEPGTAKGDVYAFVQATYTGNDGYALENFNPTLPADPFKWIPKGLMLDLIDNTPGEYIVNDKVSNYTIQQIFSALQFDVTSVPQFKARLLQQNPGNATNNYINALFASYGY